MKPLYAIVALLISATPVLANYGDVDTQLASLELATVEIAQPLSRTNDQFADADVCNLPMTHLVEVPVDFIAETGVEMACLEE